MGKSKIKPVIKKPPQAQIALERLERAVAIMESAAGEKAAAGGQLDEMRARNAALSEANKAVSERLDGAISRIKEILEDRA